MSSPFSQGQADGSRSCATGLTKQDFVPGLCKVGLKAGDVALIHSAMRTFGPIEGGARTVVSALLEVLGKRGTLVAPTFTYAHEAEQDPIIDPQNDPSETGIISETVRLHPEAVRSIAYRHSFSAIGRWAQVITDVDPALSPFDLRSSFGVMLALNTQVLLLGMTYATSSTSHHFAEWICEVPYRHKIPLNVRVRRPDGSIVEQPMIDYQPFSYSGSRRNDFNRLGKMLEDRGLVGVTTIGNAVVRRFAMRDLIDLAQVKCNDDYNIFRTEEGKTAPTDFTRLAFGKAVLSKPKPDSVGRVGVKEWSVIDENKMFRSEV